MVNQGETCDFLLEKWDYIHLRKYTTCSAQVAGSKVTQQLMGAETSCLEIGFNLALSFMGDDESK